MTIEKRNSYLQHVENHAEQRKSMFDAICSNSSYIAEQRQFTKFLSLLSIITIKTKQKKIRHDTKHNDTKGFKHLDYALNCSNHLNKI